MARALPPTSVLHTGASRGVLVERDEAVRVVRDAVARRPSLVVVEGEAGIGKTRLVEAVQAVPARTGVVWAVGRCTALRDPLPYGALVECVRGLEPALAAGQLNPVTAALRPLVPELGQVLPAPLPPLGDPAVERHQLFRGFVELLRAAGPVVVVVEDLHWADSATLELLPFLVARLPADVGVIVTTRTPDPGAGVLAAAGPVARRIRLDGLSPAGVGALAASVLGVDEVTAEFAGYLYEQTAGLPFAVEELLGLLQERQDLVRQGRRWLRREIAELQVPPRLSASILQRLGHAAVEVRAVVEAAAVLNRPAADAELFAVSGIDPAAGAVALADGVQRALLCETPRGTTVRHALARQAVYEATPPPRLRWLHARAAETLAAAADPQPAEIAHHFRLAGRRAEWLAHAEAAADRAVSIGNHALAADLLTDALPVTAPDARPRLARKLGSASFYGGSSRNLGALEAVLAAEGVDDGELRFLYARLLVMDDRADEAIGELERAIAQLDGAPARAAHAMSTLAVAGVLSGRPHDFSHWLDRAEELAADSGDADVQRIVAIDRASVLVSLGDPRGWDAAARIPPEDGSAAAHWQHVRALTNLAFAATALGRYERAQKWLEEGLAAENVYGYHADVLAATDIAWRWATGDWTDLEARVEAFTAEPRATSPSAGVACVRAGLALAAGDLDRAAALYDDVLRSGAAPEGALAEAAGGTVRLLLARQEQASAMACAHRAVARLRAEGSWQVFAGIGVPAVTALLDAGAQAEAQSLVAEVGRGLAGRDAPAATAALETCQAMLLAAADDPDAAHALVRAEHAWLELPRPHDAAHVALRHGVWLLGRGDAGGAAEVQRAATTYLALGATWDADRAAAVLRHHGITPVRRRGRKPYGGRLSPREAEVVALAAAGHTNRQIAQRLFLSQRTVEGHVARALRKLGVPSRELLKPGDLDIGAR